MATTADRLKEAMIMKGMRQADLCKATGIRKSSMSLYLKGTYLPKQYAIYEMSRALNVSEAYLMCLTDDPTRRVTTENETVLLPIQEELIDIIKQLDQQQCEKVSQIIQLVK